MQPSKGKRFVENSQLFEYFDKSFFQFLGLSFGGTLHCSMSATVLNAPCSNKGRHLFFEMMQSEYFGDFLWPPSCHHNFKVLSDCSEWRLN